MNARVVARLQAGIAQQSTKLAACAVMSDFYHSLENRSQKHRQTDTGTLEND